jgi:hypothetical protein
LLGKKNAARARCYEQPAAAIGETRHLLSFTRFQPSSGECWFASRYKEKTMRKIGLILTAIIALAAGGTLATRGLAAPAVVPSGLNSAIDDLNIVKKVQGGKDVLDNGPKGDSPISKPVIKCLKNCTTMQRKSKPKKVKNNK